MPEVSLPAARPRGGSRRTNRSSAAGRCRGRGSRSRACRRAPLRKCRPGTGRRARADGRSRRRGSQEAGAAHDLGAHQRRGDGQREAVLLGLVHGHGEHGDLHTGHLATQEVEAGAADLDAAAHVDAGHAGAEGQVVLGLEAFGREVANLANLLDDHVVVLAAFGSFGLHDVGELPHGGGVFLGGGIGLGLVFGDFWDSSLVSAMSLASRPPGRRRPSCRFPSAGREPLRRPSAPHDVRCRRRALRRRVPRTRRACAGIP